MRFKRYGQRSHRSTLGGVELPPKARVEVGDIAVADYQISGASPNTVEPPPNEAVSYQADKGLIFCVPRCRQAKREHYHFVGLNMTSFDHQSGTHLHIQGAA
jgi:hypothetical protein